jgi:hypothetical protein
LVEVSYWWTLGWIDVGAIRRKVPLRFVASLSKVTKITRKKFTV